MALVSESEKIRQVASLDSKGDFCFMLSPGKYSLKVITSVCVQCISNAVALLSRIHPTSKWLPRLLQPLYTCSYMYIYSVYTVHVHVYS